MSDNNDIKRIDCIKIRECYELARKFAVNENVRIFMDERLKKLPDDQITLQSHSENMLTDTAKFSIALDQLSHDTGNNVQSTDAAFVSAVPYMKDNSEKHYILALLALKTARNETQRIQAMRHITSALGYLPGDPRYIALANILHEASVMDTRSNK